MRRPRRCAPQSAGSVGLCAGLRPVGWLQSPEAGSRAKAREPAYPVLNTGLGEGMLRPPSNPRASRAAAGATDGRGRAPDPRTGARLAAAHRCGAAHLTLADQAAFGKAETLRLQKALEPGHKDVSGLGGHAAHAQTAGDSRSSTVSTVRSPAVRHSSRSSRRRSGNSTIPARSSSRYGTLSIPPNGGSRWRASPPRRLAPKLVVGADEPELAPHPIKEPQRFSPLSIHGR